jgi:hypothetical protein
MIVYDEHENYRHKCFANPGFNLDAESISIRLVQWVEIKNESDE